MVLQMTASGVALIAFILAFMVAPGLPAFATLLAVGLLGVFVVQAPLCKPRLPFPPESPAACHVNFVCVCDKQAFSFNSKPLIMQLRSSGMQME